MEIGVAEAIELGGAEAIELLDFSRRHGVEMEQRSTRVAASDGCVVDCESVGQRR